VGVSLVANMPMSEARRAAIQREEEREEEQARKAAELKAQQRSDAAIERRWDLEREGFEPASVQERLAAIHAQTVREEKAAAARAERDAAAEWAASGDFFGPGPAVAEPEPRTGRPPRWEIAAKQRELDDHEQSPATLAQVHELQGKMASLLAKIYAATGRKLI
jgi:hypothetical protein